MCSRYIYTQVRVFGFGKSLSHGQVQCARPADSSIQLLVPCFWFLELQH
jgi:hypothetical protein